MEKVVEIHEELEKSTGKNVNTKVNIISLKQRTCVTM